MTEGLLRPLGIVQSSFYDVHGWCAIERSGEIGLEVADANSLIGVGEVSVLGFLHGPCFGPKSLVDHRVVGQQRLALFPTEVQRFGVVDNGGLRLIFPYDRSESLVIVGTGDDDHVVIDIRPLEMFLEVTFQDPDADSAQFVPTAFTGHGRVQRHKMIPGRCELGEGINHSAKTGAER